MTRWLAPLLVVPLAACQAHLRAPAALAPLGDEAEVYVYLRPLPPEAARLSFELAGVAAVADDGSEHPLQLRVPTVAAARPGGERLLAFGRLPPGRYAGLAVHVARAALAREDGPAALVVPAEPVSAGLPFVAGPRSATVVSLALRSSSSVESTFRFDAGFVAALPERAFPDQVALCPNAGMAGVSVLDRRARRVTAVLPTGGSPRAVAISPDARRAYVAVADDDAVDVLEPTSGAALGRIRLSPGDRPWDLALTPDGRTLLVANPGSSTVSFVDAGTLAEVQRLPTGDGPSALLLDRRGQRGYVLDRRAGAVTVLDVANRAVVATVATGPEPLRAALDAAGRRLYVVHAGSPYLEVLSLPDLAPAGRVFVGLGASTVLVDSRTDLVYVGRSDARRLDVFDPYALAPVSTVDVPAPVAALVIDDAEGSLWALMPEARAVAILDLATQALLATVDVGDGPAALALTGARP